MCIRDRAGIVLTGTEIKSVRAARIQLKAVSYTHLEAYFTKKKLGPEPTKKAFKYAPFERALMTSST